MTNGLSAVPGMPGGIDPTQLTPDAVKKIIEEETAKLKDQVMRIPLMRKLMGKKERILLKVDKEGAQDRLCDFFYKRLQQILDTSKIIDKNLDVRRE
jgi:hypothetical protein